MEELFEELLSQESNKPDEKNPVFAKKQELMKKLEPRSPIEIQYKKCVEKLDEPIKIHNIVTLDLIPHIKNNNETKSKVDDVEEHLIQNSRDKTVEEGTVEPYGPIENNLLIPSIVQDTPNVEKSNIDQNIQKDDSNSPSEKIKEDDSKFGESKTQQIRENIERSRNDVFNEVEKSLSMLFADNKDESIEKRGDIAADEILNEAATTNHVTFETSIVAASVGMLKRGRKLFNHENEEENYLNFTIGQKNMEVIHEVDEPPPKLKNLSEYQTKNKKKNKTFSGPGKKDRKSVDKINEISKTIKNKNKTEPSLRKLSKSKRHDDIIARAIERLKTPNTPSKDPYSFTSKNISGEKYKLDFSHFRERMQKRMLKETNIKWSPKKRSKIELKFQNSFDNEPNEIVENHDQELITENSARGGSNEKNRVIENQDEEIDETIKIIMRNLGLLCQKISNGTLKKPGPSVQKKLLAASKLLMDI